MSIGFEAKLFGVGGGGVTNGWRPDEDDQFGAHIRVSGRAVWLVDGSRREAPMKKRDRRDLVFVDVSQAQPWPSPRAVAKFEPGAISRPTTMAMTSSSVHS